MERVSDERVDNTDLTRFIFGIGILKMSGTTETNSDVTSSLIAQLPSRSTVGDEISIHFEDIACTVAANGFNVFLKGKKTILKNVSGDFEGGKFTAVMGPSGSGKSTLMDIITGYRSRGVTGSMYMNGALCDSRQITKKSCYIMQDNQLHPLVTVKEAMVFAANIKLKRSLTNIYKEQLVSKILTNFGLTEHQNTMTEKLSGGQRKRLAVAVELVCNPAILFLDEPTSGLDSKSAKQCLEILRGLTAEGKTVVCSIHQPSTPMLNLFHNAFILTNGECIYEGTVNNIVPYLTANNLECPIYHNPIEFVLEVCLFADEQVVRSLVDSIKNGKSRQWLENPKSFTPVESSSKRKTKHRSKNEDTHYATPAYYQMFLLLKRMLLMATRDRYLTYLMLACNIGTALALGAFFSGYGNEAERVFTNANLVFCWIMYITYGTLTSRLITFPAALPVTKREHFNGWYSLGSYYVASTIGDIPVQVICVSLYISIIYYLSGQPMEWFRFSRTSVTLFLLAFIFQDYGILWGTLFEMQVALVLGMFSIFPWVMFSGFLLYPRDTLKAFQWMYDVSPLRSAFEVIIMSIYGFDRSRLHCSKIMCLWTAPRYFLDYIDVPVNVNYELPIPFNQPLRFSRYQYDFAYLICVLIVIKFCSFIALHYVVSGRR